MKQVWTDLDETVSKPFVIPQGVTARGGIVRMADDYNFIGQKSYGVVTLSSHSAIEGLMVEGWPHETWMARQDQYPGSAVWMVEGTAMRATGVKIHSFIGHGIYARDFQGFTMEDCQIHGCSMPIGVDWPRVSGNRQALVRRITLTDTVGTPRQGMGPSILKPGQIVGGNYLYGSGVDGGIFEDIWCLGEGKGFKMTGLRNVTYRRLRVPALWLGGFVDETPVPSWWALYKGPFENENVALLESVIGESTFGYGATQLSDPNTFIIDGKHKTALRVEGTTVLVPRPGPLWAPWWGDKPAPGFKRFAGSCVQRGGKVAWGDGCQFVDLHGDVTEPPPTPWITVDATSQSVESPSVPRLRFVPEWHA